MTYLTLDPKLLREQAPLSVKAITQWLHGAALATVPQGVDATEFRKHVQDNMGDPYIDNLIEYGGRQLFDFFDFHNIYIGFHPQTGLPDGKVKIQWIIACPEEAGHVATSEGLPDRITAEKEVLEEAFQRLEKKLAHAAA